jgi:dihydrodipicolinate synthase/N-acetylneuraminate lyase
MLPTDEYRSRLRGPVCSIPTPFTKAGEIDERGVRSIIDVALEAGSQVILITEGDSLFSILGDDEIGELTRLVVDHVAGRALTVAAGALWWTGKVVEFASWCRDLGYDIFLVRPPVVGSPSPDAQAAHYAAVADVMPTMLVGDVPLKTLSILAESAPGVVAFKDDIQGHYGFTVARQYADRWVVISSGPLWLHYALWPYGSPAWLSNYIVFAPQVTEAYWNGLQRGDEGRVKEVILRYDCPWWDFASTFTGGGDGLWHTSFEIFGVTQRWRRSPYVSAGDREMEQARAFYRGLGLL